MGPPQPLAGKVVVITRPWADARPFAEKLCELGAGIVSFPTIEIVPEPLPQGGDYGGYDWFVFTSANGVRMFESGLEKRGHTIADLADTKMCAVGPATAEAVKAAGLEVDLMPDEYMADSLAGAFKEKIGGLEGTRMLLPRGDLARGSLVEDLEGLGAEVTPLIVYRTQCPETDPDAADALVATRPSIVTFTSASTVHNFGRLLGDSRIERLEGHTRYAAIGPETTKALQKGNLKPCIEARTHTTEGLLEIIRDVIGGNQQND